MANFIAEQGKSTLPAEPRQLRSWLADAAREVPKSPALDGMGGVVSYEALADAVAERSRRLKEAGFGGGDRVAIAAARGRDTIVSILACVEAGVGYVPLDLSYPAERIQAMLDASQPRAVLGEVEAMDRLRRVAGETPTLENPAPAAAIHGAAADLTYVLFTSGSTGMPKGVAMGESPLASLIAWHSAHPRLGLPARTLQFAPLSFDVHFQEIFSTIACRGTLVLLPELSRRDPSLLHAAFIEHRVERIFVPYVALQMLAEASRDLVPPSLRDVISAGEQLQVTPAIRSLFTRLPGSELHNHYGPTESHVVTAHELRGDATSWPEIPPIGKALPHAKLALRDPETGKVVASDSGELLLGGETLAHGYLGQPELSAERFRCDIPGLDGTWYVTGDLVKRDAEGTHTYLGRGDQQVKVDGFRIEPGEIELLLMSHPAVKDAVVTAPDLPGIGKQLVAYLVLRDPSAEFASVTSSVRALLRAGLPEYMVPVRYERLERLPTTPSGKIDRRGLPLPQLEAMRSAASPAELARSLWQELLGLAQIGDDQNLFDLGARSLLVLRFIARMKELGVSQISVADVYDRPTLAGITGVLQGQAQRQRKRAPLPSAGTQGIAIVGMATRTAGADGVDAFWANLMAEKEGIRHFALDELDPSVPASVRGRPNFVAARGVLDDVARFDAGFFGMSAREATVVDPQQRLMLELCWSALEHAAIDPSRSDQRVGVYAGTGNNTYVPALRAEQPELIQQYGEFAVMLASEKDYVATRVSHRLNLNGPAVSIHTACSTGLVAVAQAWHALASGQCDVALAGGTSVVVPQEGGYLHVEGGMESADGHCRPFDAEASGTIFASGGGVVVLKRLDDALSAGDTVYGVIRGVGINNDGGDKASFTAPSVSGQAGAIRMALDHAQVSARSIGYVEAHGTGTSLGDPIEIAALTRAWREDTLDNQFCGLGSVKSNLGHMVAAAGVVGLVKATLALHRELIPATLHFKRPNAQIDFANSPFYVVAKPTPWQRGAAPRRAAVSSFGVGGTNAHVIVEEAPLRVAADEADDGRRWLLPVSAATGEAALRRARDLADHIESHPELALSAVAHTLMRGRKPMAHRLTVTARDGTDAVAALRGARSAAKAMSKPRIVFLFPGQGSQHPGMARRLYAEVPAFREAIDQCLALAEPLLDAPLRDWLVLAEPTDASVAGLLAETRYAQPALFCVSYALAAWLDSLGVKPTAMIGHSIGEYAAACAAGVFSVGDAVKAVVARGQAMFEQPRGAMLAVRTDADTVAAALSPGVEIAGCNAPTLTVVAGTASALDTFAAALESRDIGTTRLKVSHAFHSETMDGALPKIKAALADTDLHAPIVPMYSCVSGQLLAASEATDPAYWARQVRATVQFSRAVRAELLLGDTVFVEVGPGQALTALLRQHRTPKGDVPRIVALLGPANDPGDAAQSALNALGALWCAGVEVAWPVAANAQRVSLPTYPFGGERHWFTRRTAAVAATPMADLATPAPASLSVALPTPPPAFQQEVTPAMSRLPRLEQELTRILSDVSGIAAEDMTCDSSFVDQGLDSLSLTQATLELERVFGMKLRFRRLLEDLDSVGKLAAFLDAELPADKFAPPPVAAPVAVAVAVAPGVAAMVAPLAGAAPISGAMAQQLPMQAVPAGAPFMQHLFSQQMQLMSQQLALLSGQPVALATSAAQQVVAPAVEAVVQVPPAPSVTAPTGSGTAAAPVVAEPAQPSIRSLIEKPFGAAARITLDAKQDFTLPQRQWLDDFVKRYTTRSGKSKAFSQQHRKVMADPRVVTGFNPLWKDLVYPIVVDRSSGANLWDLDGNEYIDLLSCFGGNLLGYQAPTVIEAMSKQLQLGLEVGPQHPLAADVAHLISEFTGMERVGFCNTGSEAVMGAMRIARTVTGRKTIAIFTNSYHGIFDEVIVRGTKQLRSLSAAPGILANAVENILVLDWNSEESLRVLRERGTELAAIMTEPIQNKYPTLQPREFVQSLRQIADSAGCALIFDEVVTGFRVAPGGAQEFYGVRADIATYGKVIGGGLPFAAIAGNANWLDALDGGHWQYGDDSYPEAGVTYFAGTFVRHPLALAAAHATLLHLKQGGREFYRQLADRTQRMVDRLNTAFTLRGAPVKAVHCASIWRLQWDDNQKYVSLFYYLVRHHGLHLYEQFGHFVTEAMTDQHTDRIFQVFTNALDELMALGFIAPKDSGPAPIGNGPEGSSKAQTQTQAQLSPGQTERWLAGGFDPHARRALNESFCISLHGGVDRLALKAALQDVLTRHEAFRIKFDLVEPRQLLMPPAPMPVTEVDLSARANASEALDEFCSQASLHDFPLDQAPLAAVSLLELSDGRVVVHVVASHLVFDGWASSVFNAELATAYKARSIGIRSDFKPAESPLRFADQESARFAGADGQESLRFWQEQLRDPPAQLNLGDRMPHAPRTYAADTQRMQLGGDVFARLRMQARQSGATLFQLLLTAVTVMLHKRSGQGEFVVSIPFASQILQRRGPLMGDGVLDLPLRLGCSATESTAEVLQRVRSRLMDALEHPLMTQGTVARVLGIRSAGDRPPLTGIYFNLNPKVDLSAYAPLVASMHEGRKRGTLSELFFNFYEKEDALTLDLHYSSEFFSPERARELVEQLMGQCAALAQSPTSPAFEAPKTPTPAIDPRVIAWNRATAVPLEPNARVERCVSRQAAATPDAVALIAQGTTLTYAALESRANRFANLLRSRGIGAGMLVGVCLTRGPDLVPSLLGILKTGAAYVPLDPGFPKDRLHYMADDAGVRLVITDAGNAALTGVSREQQLRIDDDAAAIAGASDTAVAAQADWPEDAAAYVIYTSGSTGKPKGVVLPQRAVCNFLASMRKEPGLKASDRLLAVTTLSFDIAVLELFLPLTTGACVVLAQREDAMDGEVLARLASEQGINVMQATPTTWHMLLDANWRAPAGFRALCGGEPLPPSLAERLLEAGVELWNMYGPTETTVWSTLCRITDAKQKITIGYPIANTQVWVLDEQLKPCAIGQEGELCIGGVGVATGYFNRPELTAEKFIADPFDRTLGARIYRTGDLSRWREDGTIEHLGRLDFQVKIRGYRIELGEIEARLAALPGVARTVVMAREDSPGDVRLVGYFVPQPGATPDAAQMRDTLRTTLPDYMLPQHIVAIEAMPLLPNGKIDRKALPSPAGPVMAANRDITSARNDLERSVAEAMQSVLKATDVGVHDDFFSLGGHSLLAARLIGQLNRDLGMQLSLRTLFESPTVEKLAHAIERARSASSAPQRAPILHRAQQNASPLTIAQERIRFVEEMHPGRVVYNAPSGHRLRGPMNLQAFDRAFSEMVRRQPALRTSIVASGAAYVQRIDEAPAASLLPLDDLTTLEQAERESVLLQRMQTLADETFQLDHGPLYKVRLFKLADEDHALFFMAHHVIWDGWSFDVLYTEISALYEAYAAGSEPMLAPLPITFGDYAQWHNDWMQSQELKDQVSYWKKQFEQGSALMTTEGDFPRSKAADGRGATEWMEIDNARIEPLRGLAKRAGTTLSIAVLSVYAALMSHWLRDPMPSIGMPVRGRGTPELEGIMGFFNNMLPIRLGVNTSQSCIEWIKSVHQTMVASYASQDAPFELLASEREVSGGKPARLYQVMFSYQDARARQTHWGTLAHERVPVLQRGATEDINLWMVEIPSGIEGGVQYNPDLFLPATAAALRDRFLNMLDDLMARPEQSVGELLRARPHELAILQRWASPTFEVPRHGDFLEAISSRALAKPAQVALQRGHERVTFGELAQRLDAFEVCVAALGARAGDRAALCIGDPVAHLIAGLALLRVGLSIECIESTAPASLTAVPIESQRTTFLVSDEAPTSGVPSGVVWCDANMIPGNKRRSAAAQEPPANGSALSDPIDRASLAQMLAAVCADLKLLESDRALCFADDARSLLLFIAAQAWSAGAALQFATDDLAGDAQGLGDLLVAQQIALMHASGTTWRTVLSGTQGRMLDLVAMVDVTESSADLVQALLDRGCTVMSVYRPQSLGMPVAAGLVLQSRDCMVFGHPLRAGTIEIVDAQGLIVPPGVAGELRFAGASRSTRALARWRSDGVLQYLGELDAVAYIEGRRLRLDRLAASVRALPGVESAAVVVRDDAILHRCLVVGIEPRPEASPDASHWEAAVRALVPGLASMRITIAPLPRLANGQVDLATLSSRRKAPSSTTTAVTPTQREIIDVWQELLDLSNIGLQDNFFELGGTSLNAMQAAQKLEQRLGGRRVSPRRYVFETLAQLAAAFDDVADATGPIAVTIEPAANEPTRSSMMNKLKRLVRRA